MPKDGAKRNRDSTVEAIRHAGCCGKQQYRDLAAAEAGIAQLLKKHNGGDGEPLFAYACVFCSLCHIGRTPKTTTLSVLSDVARMARYNFTEPCFVCGTHPKERPLRPGEKIGRTAKARKMARVLIGDGIDADRAKCLSADEWVSVRHRAGVARPSNYTLAEVIRQLTVERTTSVSSQTSGEANK